MIIIIQGNDKSLFLTYINEKEEKINRGQGKTGKSSQKLFCAEKNDLNPVMVNT